MRKIKVKNCPVCGKGDMVRQYMVDNQKSYYACDRCKISTSCGMSALQAADNWNALTKFGR